MDNYSISENFSLLAKLMDIHGENSFKTKTYAIAAFNIDKMPESLKDTPRDSLFKLKGIGESVGKKICEMLDTGELKILKEYIANTPPGIIQMLQIKGIGPKKINTIWKEMEIESIGELLYACNENRLTRFKGFGEKTQLNVQEAIQFFLQHQGSFLYAEIEALYPQINSYLEKLFGADNVRITGNYRRQELTIDELAFVVNETNTAIKPKFQSAQPPELLEETANNLVYKLKNGLKLRLHTGKGNIVEQQFLTTGNNEFVDAFKKAYPKISYPKTPAPDDRGIFEASGIAYVPPFLRESAGILELARKKKLPTLIETGDIRAIIHSHSTWSDGINTIEDMAKECSKRGFEYLVLSDHSKSAFYANGLTEERIREQHQQIDLLNTRLAPFKIFKSIESDILNDGSLDYPEPVLKTFDLIIASIHSNLKMPIEKSMQRLIKAIENPYTTILGHMTGRLLLSRSGYPVDHKKVIDACSANGVVIEINAHPRRLDIDWKWVSYCMEKGVLLSIDPDAHQLEGFDDIRYGVLAAQKGGLTKEHNLSSYSLKEFEAFLKNKKAGKSKK